MNYGIEIIEMLEGQGIIMNKQIENTINMLAREVYTKGIEEGIKEGKTIGINKACREMEMKISSIRNEE